MIAQSLQVITDYFSDLTESQKDAICTTDGPILIIAGPGTGKTLVLVLRTIYLLLSGKASSSEILLTTFTEKAAFEIRDRISQIAKKLQIKGSLHEIKIGTIHNICDTFISKYRPYTPLGNNYVILDDLTQHLFIFEYFDEIVGKDTNTNGKYLGRWSNKWSTIKGLIPYINKITEELIDPNDLISSSNQFTCELGKVYDRYQHKMFECNKVDFSHLQKIFLDMLRNPEVCNKIKSSIKYVMVDEYQDTNYIQEQIIFELSKPDYNICVVGDEDQALYRFRGATVRNILEFPKQFHECKVIKLLINFRSHPKIIGAYNKFINSIDWSSKDGKYFRFPDKQVLPPKDRQFPDYPAVFCIWGKDADDESNRIAQMVKFLRENDVIQDYSDVAILLRSVRLENSGSYMDALKRYNIPYFCPRARAYFENNEIKLMLACFAIIFSFDGRYIENYEYKNYINEGLMALKRYLDSPIADYLQRKNEQISLLKQDESLDLSVCDYFYQLLAYKPFSEYLKLENSARNLAIFSQILSIFQLYYQVSVVTFSNKDQIKFYLFDSFLRFLIEGGMDEYEDPDNPIPKGFVQIMTIHQSKGLEFPIVIVGSLDKRFRSTKNVDRDLAQFYPKGVFEPENRITEFDAARQFYVAFSRAQKILVLTTATQPQDFFSPIWEGLDQWPYVKKETLKAQKFVSKPQFVPKKSFALTSDINVYEICPKQYQFYKEYSFQPSRVGEILFGTIVHQTISDIHKLVLSGNLEKITSSRIEQMFETNYKALLATGKRPLGATQKEIALNQVLNYFRQNKDLMERIVETEVDVSVEKEDYIILGKIDLLLGRDNKLEILDFKTQSKPEQDDPLIERYAKQLSLYAYILKQRYGKTPERLLLYWTAEEKRKDAIMEFKYDESLVEDVSKHFDNVVRRILSKDFSIRNVPDTNKVCSECDFRFFCSMDGTIMFKGEIE